MTLTCRTSVTPVGNPTTGFTIAIPSDVVAGEALYLPVTSRGNPTNGLPTVTDDEGAGSWGLVIQSIGGQGSVWWKRATSNTAGKTITVADCVNSSSGGLSVYAGARQFGLPHRNHTAGASEENNLSGDEQHAGFTPKIYGSMVCISIHNVLGANAITSVACTTPGALTTRFEKLSTGGNECATIHASALQTGGPDPTGTITWSQATNSNSKSLVWSIAPAVFNIFQPQFVCL